MSQANEGDAGHTNPDETALFWKERGNRLYTQRQYEDASKAYRKGLDALQNLDSPLAISLNSNSAMVFLKLKEFEEAVEVCNWILAKEPKNTKGTNDTCAL